MPEYNVADMNRIIRKLDAMVGNHDACDWGRGIRMVLDAYEAAAIENPPLAQVEGIASSISSRLAKTIFADLVHLESSLPCNPSCQPQREHLPGLGRQPRSRSASRAWFGRAFGIKEGDLPSEAIGPWWESIQGQGFTLP